MSLILDTSKTFQVNSHKNKSKQNVSQFVYGYSIHATMITISMSNDFLFLYIIIYLAITDQNMAGFSWLGTSFVTINGLF